MKDLRASIALFMTQTPAELVTGFLITAVAIGTLAGLWIISPN